MPKLIAGKTKIIKEEKKELLNPDDAEWYDRETLQELKVQLKAKPVKESKKKADKPSLISITEKEKFINWLRTSTSNNPQLKRIRLKDGGFRDCVPRGMIDLFNEYVEET